MDPLALILLALALIAAWLAWRLGRVTRMLAALQERPAGSLELLQREVQAVRSGVDVRLREQLEQTRALAERLGRLQTATEHVEQLGEDLRGILEPSQLRGAFGELLLEKLLADTLPRERFHIQYTYPTSGVRVDAAVLLGDGRVLPIDSKFPLDNLRRYRELRGKDEQGAEAARRAFTRDVRGHVDVVAERYLSPEDGALDVAFLYIPSESVFHELTSWDIDVTGTPLIEYAIRRRVVPVSPNTLSAYLCVVRMGLRGFRLQESARAILEHLTHLQSDIEELRSQFSTAIRQASHSLNNMRQAERTLSRAEGRLGALEAGEVAQATEGG